MNYVGEKRFTNALLLLKLNNSLLSWLMLTELG